MVPAMCLLTFKLCIMLIILVTFPFWAMIYNDDLPTTFTGIEETWNFVIENYPIFLTTAWTVCALVAGMLNKQFT